MVDGESSFAGLLDSDIEESVQRGSGPGGQHRNKTESCVRLKHKPTGIEVRIDMRSQHRSRAVAMEVLTERVVKHYQDLSKSGVNSERQAQIGSGMRGDKVRTYREQDNVVIDHLNNRKARLSDVLKGDLSKFYQ